jgi:hypothetical protein
MDRRIVIALSGMLLAAAAPATPDTAPVRLQPASRGPADTIFVPASIDASGKTDVTLALNAWLSRVRRGTTVMFPRNGNYRLDGSLRITSLWNVVIDGNGSVFRTTATGTPHRRHILIDGGGKITLKRLTVVGPNKRAGTDKPAYVALLKGQHGIMVLGTQSLSIDSVTITDIYGDFVYMTARGSRWTEADWTDSVLVTRSYFARNGRQGITFIAARNVVFRDNYIGQVRMNSIDIEPHPTGGAVNIVFESNIFGPARLFWLAAGGFDSEVSDVVLHNNRLIGRDMRIRVKTPDKLPARRNIRITNNSSDTPYQIANRSPLMAFSNWDGVTVTNNEAEILGGPDPVHIALARVCSPYLALNRFVGAKSVTRVSLPNACLPSPKQPDESAPDRTSAW